MGKAEPVQVDPALPELGAAAAALGARAHVVGGYVRDRLLGRAHPDLDVVVEDARALELAETFARRVGARPPVLFPRFGTAQVTWESRLIEFASARSESYARDSRKPAVRPASLEDDLRRRDFTVNALLMDFEGQVSDPLGTGLPDLAARLLRTPRDPLETFDDDPLRMLRAVRFAVQLDFQLAPDLLPAMRRLADRVRPPVVSVERVTDELRKMLLSPQPARALDLLQQGALLAVVLPELEACRGVEQRGWHTHDVYGHTLETVQLSPPRLTERLAAVFHDVGKPATATPEGTFHGHPQLGAELATAALRRLRFPNHEIERVARLVELHLRPVFYDSSWKEGAVRRLVRDAGDLIWPLLDLARADIAASAYPHPEKLEELAGRVRRVIEEDPARMRPPVTGGDIMAALGVGPGPPVGRVKARIEELVLEGELEPDRAAILDWLHEHGAQLREQLDSRRNQ